MSMSEGESPHSEVPSDEVVPVPDDSLAWLSDEEQVAFIRQTDNGLTEEDLGIEQPSQEPVG